MGKQEPKQRWRKRWLALVLLWLVATYPLTAGPAWYAIVRGWMSQEVYLTLFRPAERVMHRTPVSDAYGRYLRWWVERGVADESEATRRRVYREEALRE